MKKTVVLLLLVALVAGFAVQASAQRKIRIAVLPFADDSPQKWWEERKLGEAAADLFTTKLLNTNRFTVLERKELDAILKEQNLGASGRVTSQSAADIGKLLGVQLMVLGSVTEFSAEAYGGRFRSIGGNLVNYKCGIDIRVVNVETGEILYANRESGSHRDIGVGINSFEAGRDSDYGKVAAATMQGAVEKLVAEIAKKSESLKSESLGFGMVALVADTQVFINRGSVDNVQIGDRFEVFRLGDEVVDPETGEVLDKVKLKVGVIEVISVKEKSATCILVEGSADKGDVIQQQ